MSREKINITPFVIILIFLFLPVVQKYTHFINEQKLGGYIPSAQKPEFTLGGVFNEEFQNESETYLKRSVGFLPTLVRVCNQFNFTLFQKLNAATIVEGKEKHKFATQYINSYLGVDFIGDSTIKEKVRKLDAISQVLKSKGTTILVVIAPGKGIFHSEYIHDQYKEKKKDSTNYKTYLEYLSKSSVEVIDFIPPFLYAKDTSRYIMFPKYGIHWSIYSNVFVSDSIAKYISFIKQVTLPSIKVESIEVTSRPRGSDRDIEDALNLILPFYQKNMAYPKLRVDTSQVLPKLNVLGVADSYYWTHYSLGCTNVYKKHVFWFYYKDVYPRGADGKTHVAQEFDLRFEVESRDVIILMANDAKLKDFAWGFIEDVYDIYY